MLLAKNKHKYDHNERNGIGCGDGKNALQLARELGGARNEVIELIKKYGPACGIEVPEGYYYQN